MAHNDTRRRRLTRCPPPSTSAAAAAAVMDPGARRRACVEFRVTLSQDTGVNLTAADCEALLDGAFRGEGGEEITLQSNPGRFYTCLGEAIEDQTLSLVLPDHELVAWFCYREAAEVYRHPTGMRRLAECYYTGQGVTEDAAQAAVWFEKAADLGELPAKAALGWFHLNGDPRASVAKDAGRGFALLREAVEQGYGVALVDFAQCYLRGNGVEKDAAHGVTLLLEAATQDDPSTAEAQKLLTVCYMEGNGVEADTAQAAAWCQKAADGGDEDAFKMLPIIRTCDFCGTTPAREHCERCRKVRYYNTTCQAAHWNRETDPHKGDCRRAAGRRTARPRRRSREPSLCWQSCGCATAAQQGPPASCATAGLLPDGVLLPRRVSGGTLDLRDEHAQAAQFPQHRRKARSCGGASWRRRVTAECVLISP